ncbi:hypothetical protein CRYUN_Cryun06bG0109900 [Craigia yunnanensis]
MTSMLNSIRCMSTSSKKLLIGDLSYGTNDQTLKEAFFEFGDVTEARIIIDKDIGRSRGCPKLDDINKGKKIFGNFKSLIHHAWRLYEKV